MDHDGAVGNVVIGFSPHALINILGGKDALGVLHQKAQDFIFNLRQLHLLAPNPHLVIVQADPNSPGRENIVPAQRPRLGLAPVNTVPAQQSFDPPHQLRIGKGFGEIVVPAGNKPHQLIRLLGFGGEEQDRNCGALANLLADMKPRKARHHNIQNHKIHRIRQPFQSLMPIGRLQNHIVLSAEQNAKALPDFAVIIHN